MITRLGAKKAVIETGKYRHANTYHIPGFFHLRKHIGAKIGVANIPTARAPRRTSSRTTAKPMPPLAPVTMATLSLICMGVDGTG